jgi:hypothetical protein
MSMYGPDPYFEPPPATIGEAEEFAAREWAHRESMLPYEIARLGQTPGGLPGAQMARLEELGAHLRSRTFARGFRPGRLRYSTTSAFRLGTNRASAGRRG